MLSTPKGHIRRITAGCLLTVAAVALLSPVLPTYPELPAGEMVGQWVWIDRMMMVAAACMAVAVFLLKRGETVSPVVPLSVALLVMGSIEAVWGWRQLFGWTASGHSLYLLTGSFFNPGPYSGYLAMVLPVCLHEYLGNRQKIVRRAAGVVGAVLLCVLPAGMSRSAWIAAGVACLWVYACHAGWSGKWRRQWSEHRKRTTAWLVCGVCVLVLLGSGLFLLKPDSARGRFFMWRMACHAIAEQPWSGHGNGSFAAAYGDAQEAYFSAGDYEAWEERVAGSPEYAFNEYVQIAVEWGVPCLLGVLIAMGGGIYAGMKKKKIWNSGGTTVFINICFFIISLATAHICCDRNGIISSLYAARTTNRMVGCGYNNLFVGWIAFTKRQRNRTSLLRMGQCKNTLPDGGL